MEKMHWEIYLSTSTSGESRGTSRSSRSLKNKDMMLPDGHLNLMEC